MTVSAETAALPDGRMDRLEGEVDRARGHASAAG